MFALPKGVKAQWYHVASHHSGVGSLIKREENYLNSCFIPIKKFLCVTEKLSLSKSTIYLHCWNQVNFTHSGLVTCQQTIIAEMWTQNAPQLTAPSLSDILYMSSDKAQKVQRRFRPGSFSHLCWSSNVCDCWVNCQCARTVWKLSHVDNLSSTLFKPGF